jgi:hypothetical protein
MTLPPEQAQTTLQGYRCPACDRAFFVRGYSVASRCPMCSSELIWPMVGPFTLVRSRELADLQAQVTKLKAAVTQKLSTLSADRDYWKAQVTTLQQENTQVLEQKADTRTQAVLRVRDAMQASCPFKATGDVSCTRVHQWAEALTKATDTDNEHVSRSTTSSEFFHGTNNAHD